MERGLPANGLWFGSAPTLFCVCFGGLAFGRVRVELRWVWGDWDGGVFSIVLGVVFGLSGLDFCPVEPLRTLWYFCAKGPQQQQSQKHQFFPLSWESVLYFWEFLPAYEVCWSRQHWDCLKSKGLVCMFFLSLCNLMELAAGMSQCFCLLIDFCRYWWYLLIVPEVLKKNVNKGSMVSPSFTGGHLFWGCPGHSTLLPQCLRVIPIFVFSKGVWLVDMLSAVLRAVEVKENDRYERISRRWDEKVGWWGKKTDRQIDVEEKGWAENQLACLHAEGKMSVYTSDIESFATFRLACRSNKRNWMWWSSSFLASRCAFGPTCFILLFSCVFSEQMGICFYLSRSLWVAGFH